MFFQRGLVGLLVVGSLNACGTSSKKIIDLPPLAEDAPVEVFWSVPNLRYTEVCTIEAQGNNSLAWMYDEKEDFADMFQSEARKCGANGVIFSFLSGTKGGAVTAYATGVRIESRKAELTSQELVKAYSLAIQSGDLDKVRTILAPIAKDPAERAPSDDNLVNIGLYIAATRGLDCLPEMVTLFENEYGAHIEKFGAVLIGEESAVPLCRDVVARSFPKMADKVEAIRKINNLYVGLLNTSFDSRRAEKAARYEKLLQRAAFAIVDACAASATDPVCSMKGAYLDFAQKTRLSSVAAFKQNAKQVIGALSGPKKTSKR